MHRELLDVRSRMVPAYGIEQQAVGHIVKSCPASPPPAAALAWHRRIFGGGGKRATDADSGAKRAHKTKHRRIKRVSACIGTRFAPLDDLDDFDSILEEHEKMVDWAQLELGGADTAPHMPMHMEKGDNAHATMHLHIQHVSACNGAPSTTLVDLIVFDSIIESHQTQSESEGAETARHMSMLGEKGASKRMPGSRAVLVTPMQGQHLRNASACTGTPTAPCAGTDDHNLTHEEHPSIVDGAQCVCHGMYSVKVHDTSTCVRTSAPDPAGGMDHGRQETCGESAHRNQCLVVALRRLGVPIGDVGDGPFRALADGNSMLLPFQKCLVACGTPVSPNGRFVLWYAQKAAESGHFVAVVADEGTYTWWDDDRCVATTHPTELTVGRKCLWFRLKTKLAEESEARVAFNRATALKRRASCLTSPRPSGTSAPSTSTLTQEQLQKIATKRAEALCRRHESLRRIAPQASWKLPVVPAAPQDWLAPLVSLPEVTWLSTLNEHPRDYRLQFFADEHMYLLDGMPTCGSVTGLVHSFCEEFDADLVIERMINGRKWPRAGYIRKDVPSDLFARLPSTGVADAFKRILECVDRSDSEVADVARAFASTSAEAKSLVGEMCLSKEEIKRKWDDNRIIAANQGALPPF